MNGYLVVWDEFAKYNTSWQINMSIPITALHIGREGFEFFRMLKLKHIPQNISINEALQIIKFKIYCMFHNNEKYTIIYDNVVNIEHVELCFKIYLAASHNHWEVYLFDELVFFCINYDDHCFNYSIFHVLWESESVKNAMTQSCQIAKCRFLYNK